MNWWQAVVLSGVEGLTEFLPVSSTGHLILTAWILRLEQTDFLKTFEVVIQLGAILAVVFLYWKRLWKNPEEMKRIAAAFFPTAVVGFIGYRLIKTFLLGNTLVTVIMLAAGGLAIIVADRKFDVAAKGRKISELTYKQAVLIGLAQSLAVVPGVSRALATIWCGMAVGLSKREAVEMSFVLAVPTMAAASGYDLLKSGWSFSGTEWSFLGLGFGVSLIVALFAVKWFLNLVQQKGMIPFGWYRLLVAAAFLAAGV
jgi:undecaprenyl-diphosphatase